MDYNNVNTWRMDQDNRRRATEILIGTPMGSTYHETAYRDTRDASRDEILARVRIVGVERTAKEYKIKPKVIRRWLEKEGMTMKKKDKVSEEHVAQQVDIPLEDMQQADTPKNPAPQNPAPQKPPLKKSKDFSPEERKAIVARAKEIGTKKAAEEAGTTRFVVMNWEKLDPTYEKFAGSTPVEGTPVEIVPVETTEVKTSKVKTTKLTTSPIEIIPGTDGLPPRKGRVWEYSREERELLIAKADIVGNGKVIRAFGLPDYTLRDWRRPLEKGSGHVSAPRKPKKKATEAVPTAQKPTAQESDTPVAPMRTVLPVAPTAPVVPSAPAAPVHAAALPEPVATIAPAQEPTAPTATPVVPTQVPATPATPAAPIISVASAAEPVQEPTAPAATIHTDIPAAQAQAPQAQAPQAVQPHEPIAPVPPAVPVYTLPPVAPSAPDTIEMIRLKDRVASLEERVEKLRKVIVELI